MIRLNLALAVFLMSFQVLAQVERPLEKHPVVTAYAEKWVETLKASNGSLVALASAVEGLKRISQVGSPYRNDGGVPLALALDQAEENVGSAVLIASQIRNHLKTKPHRLAEDLLIYMMARRESELSNLNKDFPDLWVSHEDVRVREAFTYWLMKNFIAKPSDWTLEQLQPISVTQISGLARMYARVQYNSEKDTSMKVRKISNLLLGQIERRFEEFKRVQHPAVPVLQQMFDEASEVRRDWNQRIIEHRQQEELKLSDDILIQSPLDDVREFVLNGHRMMRGLPDLPICEAIFAELKDDKK